ncbi:ECF transporter S component [Agromyces sp. NPDC049794]|uniref:ECF transporter S component n=1 Tax=unclassified Agromyces TaxID=2639701 RepID=UPI0033D45C6E
MREDEYIEEALRREPGLTDEWLKQNNLMYGGLVGICIVLVQPLVTDAAPSLLGLASVILFAIAIPLLAGLILLNRQETYRHRLAKSRAVTVFRSLAMGTAFAGIVTTFWHVSWIAGAVLLVSAFVATLVHGAGYTGVEGVLRWGRWSWRAEGREASDLSENVATEASDQPAGDGAPFTLCCLLWARPGLETDLVAYEDRVLALLPDYSIEVTERVRSARGPEHPTEVQLLRVPTQALLDAYLADPRRLEFTAERDRVVARTELFRVPSA